MATTDWVIITAVTVVSPPVKTRAAAVSIVSNSCLIVLKVAAGLVTGSVGLLSDAVHSLMDLIASLIAWASVRKADVPADASHRYGLEKLKDLAAGAEDLLLLFAASLIPIDASRRLADEALPPDRLVALQQVVESFVGGEVIGYHDLRARHVGSHHQVDLHLQFAGGTSLERAHYISHQLQDAVVVRLPE